VEDNNSRMIFRQDINFFEFPMWMVNEKFTGSKWIIEKPYGRYEISCSQILPTFFDAKVLHFLHSKIKDTDFQNLEIYTNRYEVAKNVYEFDKKSEKQFERIMFALKKWASTFLQFKGIFYQDSAYSTRFFSVIDDVILNHETRQLYIRFNQQYVQQLKGSTFYIYVDFNVFKKFKRPLSARMHEILVKNFKERDEWQINIDNLAEKLTLEKRNGAKSYYPSDVLIKLKPTISEINLYSGFKIEFKYSKKKSLCNFKKLETVDNQEIVTPAKIYKEEVKDAQLVKELLRFGISKKLVEQFIKDYKYEQIIYLVELFKKNKTSIKNVDAWFKKGLTENWKNNENNKKVEFKKIIDEKKAEELKKQIEDENFKKQIEELKRNYSVYEKKTALKIFNELPKETQDTIKQQYHYDIKMFGTGPFERDEIWFAFLLRKLKDKIDSFSKWANKNGYLT